MRALVTQHVAPDSPSLPLSLDAPETKNWPGLIIVLKFTIFSLLQNVWKLWIMRVLFWIRIFIALSLLIAFWREWHSEWSDLSIGSVTVCPPLNSALASPRSHFCVRFALIHTFCSRQWNAAPVSALSALNAVCSWLLALSAVCGMSRGADVSPSPQTAASLSFHRYILGEWEWDMGIGEEIMLKQQETGHKK